MVCLVAVMLVVVVLVAAAWVKFAVGSCSVLCGGDIVISKILISRQSR